jgi:hypothetical protein
MEFREKTGAGDMSVPNVVPAYRHGARPAPSPQGSRCSRAQLRRLAALTGRRRPGRGLAMQVTPPHPGTDLEEEHRPILQHVPELRQQYLLFAIEPDRHRRGGRLETDGDFLKWKSARFIRLRRCR